MGTRKQRRGAAPTPSLAVGYIRVSTNEQATEGVSLAAQRSAITAYATLHGLTLTEIIQDAGESGGVPLAERTGGARVVALVREGAVGAVVVSKLDRAWRSAVDALATTTEWTERGVALHLIDMQLDTASAFGRMFLTMLAGLAELERGLIAERTSAALAHLRAQGVHVGRDGLGWTRTDARDGHGRREIRVVDSERELLVRIRRMRRTGATFESIARALNQERVPTKRGGARWYATTVRNVIVRHEASPPRGAA